jgi:hypothetical protein
VDADRLAVFCGAPFCARSPSSLGGFVGRVRLFACSRCCRQLDRRYAPGFVECLGLGGWEVGGLLLLLRTRELQARCFGAVANGLTGRENQKFQAGDFPTASLEFNGRQTGMLRNPANEGVLRTGRMLEFQRPLWGRK